MYRMRRWSARHAAALHHLYDQVERGLAKIFPRLQQAGLPKTEKVILWVEKPLKQFLFDSQSCGQCTLGSTGMSCPMNCPKTLRNGPCGGVRPGGKCEVKPEMDCVWVVAWEGTRHLKPEQRALHIVQPPLDARLKGRSAWLRAAAQRAMQQKPGVQP
ncbi:MAG: methylenetetrahydrofolate reductase C-terminal domain-containing protein [Thiothrix sp.]|nr:methylenetetrahydrofolate reductase C-terminal domain-containing protein [Thiothrix sp.]HPQ96766.1 methylenetetrahydrofolate reductase C-terminal domain-containing protein [Thiolinea sp.]